MSGTPAHLSLVTLGVSDVPRAVGFYRRLGWPVEQPPGAEERVAFVRLSTPGDGFTTLSLYAVVDLAADARTSAPSADGFRGVTLACNQPSADDVDRLVAAWVGAGATVVAAAEPTAWGGYSALVADPDGHVWELAHNPYSPDWAAPAID